MLLAAGRGTRLGGRPKCLLKLDGVPLILRLLAALRDGGVDEVVVVLGHYADRIAPLLEGLTITVVHNPDPDVGPVSSQRLGLAALVGAHDAVVVALADQPMIEAADIAALIDAWVARPAGAQVVHPRVGADRGNPVIVSAAVRSQVLAAPPDVGCRQWQAAHPAAVAPYITANRHYLVDVDTPADLARVERETGRALRWCA